MRSLSVLVLLAAAAAQADNEIDAKVEAALAAESRPQADVVRDANRKPLETLKFFGLKDDMRVLELFPGGGWYTRVLAPVLAENGKLYVALNTATVEESVLGEPGFEEVEVLQTSANARRPEGSRFYVLEDFDFGVSDLDMVLTFRNLHSYEKAHRDLVNREVFEALRSGGHYGVIDHTRRHMEPYGTENRRRLDPVAVIAELTALGFEFVGFSDLHYRPNDELTLEVGHESVTGQTDRFTLLFRKP